MADVLLTPEEMAVLDKLAAAWNAFIELPRQHPTHNQEFMYAIHAAQRIIMSRPVARYYGWIHAVGGDAPEQMLYPSDLVNPDG